MVLRYYAFIGKRDYEGEVFRSANVIIMVCVQLDLVWTVQSKDTVLQAGRCKSLNLNFNNVHKYIYCGVLHRFMRRSRLE